MHRCLWWRGESAGCLGVSWELDEVVRCSGSAVVELGELGMVVCAWKRKGSYWCCEWSFWVLAWVLPVNSELPTSRREEEGGVLFWSYHSSGHGACSGLKVALQALAVRGSAGEGGCAGASTGRWRGATVR